MNDCLFCKIGRKEIPAALVYEDEQMFVINDIKPQAPLHALVIPKRHIATLNELTGEHDALAGAMMRRAPPQPALRGAAVARGPTGFHTKTDRCPPAYATHLHVQQGQRLPGPP